MEYYNNCFSLGCACTTASSLSKLGIRSVSGPFDWIDSDFNSVMSQIDNEFADFMKKENLEVIADTSPIQFRDKKYNFRFPHEIKKCLEAEYDDIFDKYTRRIQRFIEYIKMPTCFFRMVKTKDEIGYIVNHVDYIDGTVKKSNDKNIIVYVLVNGIGSLPDNLRWFGVTEHIVSSDDYRNVFDTSEELLQFCKTLLSPEQIEINKKFDSQKYGQRTVVDVVDYFLQNDINGLDEKIFKMFHLNDGKLFYIFGGGVYGILLYRYLVKRGIRIEAVIDNNRAGREFPNDVPVFSPDNIEPNSNILISVINEASGLNIRNQIKDKDCHVLTYKELIHGME